MTEGPLARLRTWLAKPAKLELVSISAVGIGFVGAAAAALQIQEQRRTAETESQLIFESILSASRTDALKAQIVEFRNQLRNPDSSPSEIRLRQLETKLEVIEQALVNSPERALSVPMLRRDLDALDSGYKRDFAGLRDDVGRLYTSIMWLIGIIVTVALGLVGVLMTRKRN